MADATTRTTLFASRNAAVDDRELFLGSIAMLGRQSFGEASRHDDAGRRCTIRSFAGRLITERERESGFPSLVKGIVHRFQPAISECCALRDGVGVLPETTEA